MSRYLLQKLKIIIRFSVYCLSNIKLMMFSEKASARCLPSFSSIWYDGTSRYPETPLTSFPIMFCSRGTLLAGSCVCRWTESLVSLKQRFLTDFVTGTSARTTCRAEPVPIDPTFQTNPVQRLGTLISPGNRLAFPDEMNLRSGRQIKRFERRPLTKWNFSSQVLNIPNLVIESYRKFLY